MSKGRMCYISPCGRFYVMDFPGKHILSWGDKDIPFYYLSKGQKIEGPFIAPCFFYDLFF